MDVRDNAKPWNVKITRVPRDRYHHISRDSLNACMHSSAATQNSTNFNFGELGNGAHWIGHKKITAASDNKSKLWRALYPPDAALR